jgi:hypothetical protein
MSNVTEKNIYIITKRHIIDINNEEFSMKFLENRMVVKNTILAKPRFASCGRVRFSSIIL